MTYSFNPQLIEPYAEFLKKPDEGTLVYKIISVSNFMKMLEKKYLYFRRVDTYFDDKKDSDQPEKDKTITNTARFQQCPHHTLTKHYAIARSRTYACCFSTERTPYLWEHYGEPGAINICLVFDCFKLIKLLNESYSTGQLIVDGKISENMFCLNHGLVEYVNFDETVIKQNLPYLNQVRYTYLKDVSKYSEEKEFRTTFYFPGTGDFPIPGDGIFNFPDSIELNFDLRKAEKLGALTQIVFSKNCEEKYAEQIIERAQLHNIHWELQKT